MKKIQWKNHPDKATKISAENLNLMQENIENTLIESGNNKNGNWIKFPDGTMVCTGEIDIGTPVFEADGNVFKATLTNIEPNFPLSFINEPFVQVFSHRGLLFWTVRVENDNNKITRLILNRAVQRTGPAIIRYVAIGRWK